MPFVKKLLCFLLCVAWINCHATNLGVELTRIKESYPESIQSVTSQYILWKNGGKISIGMSFPLLERLARLLRRSMPRSENSITVKDLQCDTYEPFFKKMYGRTAEEVKKNLTTVYWMPHVFGDKYPLRVTRINDVDKKIIRISAALEKLPPRYFKYLENPAGAFYWRNVKNERYLSSHSFGIALDINSHYGNYWLWDWEKAGKSWKTIHYRNNIPMAIVKIFEQEGFLWGGRWYFYDTMHFEYRPELFAKKGDRFVGYYDTARERCEV